VSICVLAVDPTTAHCGHRYYALSAACSLLKYAELKLNTRYAAGSLRIRYVAVEGTMMIDVGTVRNLELVNNISHKKSHHSLFGYEDPGSFTRSSSHLPPSVLDYTYTAMASRLLRVNILSPITGASNIFAFSYLFDDYSPSAHSSIDARLDVVEGKFILMHPTSQVVKGLTRICAIRRAIH
jgi:hypothetical protein